MRNHSVQSRVYATAAVKTKKKEIARTGSTIVRGGRDDNLRYRGFWGGVNGTAKIADVELRHGIRNHSHDGCEAVNLEKLKMDSWMIHHQGQKKIQWDLFVGLIVIYSIVTIPYYIGFQVNTSNAVSNLNTAIDCIFIFDVMVTFNTSIVDSVTEVIIMNRRKIAETYLQFWFWVDIASSIPFDSLFAMFVQSFSTKLASVRLIKVLRLIRLSKLLKLARVVRLGRLQGHVERLNISPSVMNVIKLVLQIVFVAHLISCFWHFITTSDVTGASGAEEATRVTWVNEFGYNEAGYLTRYVASLYWTIATILSVGYGDIHATNAKERMYSVITMMGGGVMFGAVIAQVTKLIEGRNPQAKAYKEKMDELKAYLGEKLLPQKLKTEAKAAFSYYLQRTSSFGDEISFDDLPKPMLLTLVHGIYEKELRNIHLFNSSDAQFVVSLVTQTRPFKVIRGETVLSIGDLAQDIVFVLRGTVRMLAHDGTVLGYCHEGSFFGDFEYLQKTSRICTYQACMNCNLLAIDFKAVDDALQDNVEAGLIFVDALKLRFAAFQQVRQATNLVVPQQQRKAFMPQNTLATMRMSLSVTDRGTVLPAIQAKVKSVIFVDGTLIHPSAHDQDEYDNILVHEELFRIQTISKLTGDVQTVEETMNQVTKRFILHPKYTAKMYWDSVIGGLIIYSVLVIPVQIAFSDETAGGSPMISNMTDTFFLLDVLFTFRTAYYSDADDAWVVIPKKIMKNYTNTWLGIDIMSSVPFDTISTAILGSSVQGLKSIKLIKIIRLTRLLKLARVVKLAKYLNALEDYLGISPALFDLASMMMQVVFIAHMIACVWWGLSVIMTQHSWIDHATMTYSPDLRAESTKVQYLTSLYWAMTTLATVGYGDIVPTNTFGQLVNIIVMIVGATVFGYIIANVSTLMNSLNQTEMRINQSISNIKEYLREKNCPKKVSDAIVKHYKHKFHRSSAFDEVSIMNKLPRKIGCEILTYANLELMNSIPIFKYIKNRSMALCIFQLLLPEYADTSQYIIKEGEIAHAIIFFTQGTARVFRSRYGRSNFGGLESKKRNGQAKRLSKFDKAANRKSMVWVDKAGRFWETDKPLNSWMPATHEQLEKRESIVRLTQERERADKQGKQQTRKLSSPSLTSSNIAKVVDNLESPSKKAEWQNAIKVVNSSRDGKEDSEAHTHRSQEAREVRKNNVNRSSLRNSALKKHIDVEPDDFDAIDDSDFSSEYGIDSDDDGNDFIRQTQLEMKLKGTIFLGDIGKGDFVGHVGLMRHKRHAASVRAMQACTLYTLKKADMFKLLKEHPAAGLVLQMALGKAMAAMEREKGRLLVRSHRAAFLSELKTDFLKIRAGIAKLKAAQSASSGHIIKTQENFGLLDRMKSSGGALLGKTLHKAIFPHSEALHNAAATANAAVAVGPKVSKWEIVRKAIRTAKIQATVASMHARMESSTRLDDFDDNNAANDLSSGSSCVVGSTATLQTTLSSTVLDRSDSKHENTINNSTRFRAESFGIIPLHVTTTYQAPSLDNEVSSRLHNTARKYEMPSSSPSRSDITSKRITPTVSVKPGMASQASSLSSSPTRKIAPPPKKKPNAKLSIFAKAMRARVGPSIDAILNDKTMSYDSDEEKRAADYEQELGVGTAQRRDDSVGVLVTSRERSNSFVQTALTLRKNSSVGMNPLELKPMEMMKVKKMALVRKHRSESDLLDLHRRHVSHMQFLQQAEQHANKQITLQKHNRRSSFLLPSSGMFNDALVAPGAVALPSLITVKPRRMSYPSLDMHHWHNQHKEAGYV